MGEGALRDEPKQRRKLAVPGPLANLAMVDSLRKDRLISLQEVQRHNKVDDAWIVIDGKVFTLLFL